MTVPYWVQDSVFYQIFPDRFSNSDPANDPSNVVKWGSHPTAHDFQGGYLRGIIQKFDYLLDLGINAIYLNPIFAATSTHRYNTSDFYKIDPRLGDMVDFHALLDLAHRNNVRVILDGVFNHVGRGFFAFVDVLENGGYSAYKDWFHIHHLPLNPYGDGPGNFDGWWGHKALPKLNTHNKEVRNYILGIARYWMERGADGWRLDVPNEIDDDAFWAEFRDVVKKANRDAYILGEIWDVNPRWANETHFDGLMHYPVREAVIGLLNGGWSVGAFAARVEGVQKAYPRENVFGMYVPLGSHDTERFFTMMDGHLPKTKLAYLFLMCYPGAPAVYYGDEVGLKGGKDPDCRGAFPWDAAAWVGDLRPWIQTLIAQRKARPSLRRGEYVPLAAEDGSGFYAFARVLGEEKSVVALNASSHRRNVEIPLKALGMQNATLRSLLDGRAITISDGVAHLQLDAWSGALLG